MAGRRRYGTAGDMVRTLAVAGVVVLIIYLFTPHTSRGAPPALNVDYQTAAQSYAGQVHATVLEPASLPPGWTCTHATIGNADSSLSLGFYYRPDHAYVTLVESPGAGAHFLASQGISGASQGTVTAAGYVFQTRTADSTPNGVALVDSLAGGGTAVVGGGGPLSALLLLAARLHPVSVAAA